MPAPRAIPTLAPWVDVVRTRLPDCLAGEDAMARLGRAARRLPFDGLGALELRLGGAVSRRTTSAVDLALHLQTPAQARALAPRIAPPRLGRFVSSWGRGEQPAARSLWLELDLDREPAVRPVPGICAGLAEGGTFGSVPGQLAEHLADHLLPALRARPLGSALRRRLLACVAAIPAPGRLRYAASMESRPDDAVRLVVAGLDVAALAAFLARVAPADVARRAGELAPLAAGAARTHLSFDVGEAVGERFGIECSFPRLPAREPAWRGLLERWTAAGLVGGDEAEALLAWTGYDSAWTAAARWPAGVDSASAFCLRAVSHLKLVSVPQAPPHAKAYLLFGPWRRKGERAAAAGGLARERTVPLGWVS